MNHLPESSVLPGTSSSARPAHAGPHIPIRESGIRDQSPAAPRVLMAMPDLSAAASSPLPGTAPATWGWASKPRFALAGMLVVIIALAVLVFRADDDTENLGNRPSPSGHPTAEGFGEAPAWSAEAPFQLDRMSETREVSDVNQPTSYHASPAEYSPWPALRGEPEPQASSGMERASYQESTSMPGPGAPNGVHEHHALEPRTSAISRQADLINQQEMAVEQARANRLASEEQFAAASRALDDFHRTAGMTLMEAEKRLSAQQEKLTYAEQKFDQVERLVRKGYRPFAEREATREILERAKLDLQAAVRARDDLKNLRGNKTLHELESARELAVAEMRAAQAVYMAESAKLEHLHAVAKTASAARELSQEVQQPIVHELQLPTSARLNQDDPYRQRPETYHARLQGTIEK